MNSRAPVAPTLPPANSGPPRLSLRVALATGLGGLLSILLATTIVSQYLVYRTVENRRVVRLHYTELRDLVQHRLTLMLDQEVGLRGYLSSGDPRFLEPYDSGRRETAMTLFSLRSALTEPDRRALGKELAAFDRATDLWTSEVAEPQVTARRIGPLAASEEALREGKKAFDAVRDTHDRLARALQQLAEREVGALDRELYNTNYVLLLVTLVVFFAAALLIRFLLRNMVEPLAQLAMRAASNQALEAPSEGERIAELYGLSRALFELDSAARERERIANQAHAQAAALGGFGEFVQQLADDAELHGALARTMEERVGPSKLHILVRNSSHNRMEVAWPEGSTDENFKHAILAEPMRCRAVRTMQPVTSSVNAPTCCKCTLGVPKTGSYHCVPMLAAGELVGLVNMQAADRDTFEPEMQTLSQSYISFASTTLSSIRLLAATRERALRDPLTSAYNRAFLSEYLAKQLSQAARRNSPLSVLLLDLDHFKRLNDTYGHQVGDRALVAFSSCLHEQVRGSDAVIRFGGEEFVVLLCDADSNTALSIAERIRSSVERQVVNGDAAGPLGNILRCSIGVATYPTHGNDEATLIAAADRALYRAKANGRNNVMRADENAASRITMI